LKKKEVGEGGMHLCSKHTHTPAIVSIVTGYKLNEPWCDSRQGQEIFIFVSTKTSMLGLGIILPPILWVLGLFLQRGGEVARVCSKPLATISAEVKNE